MRLQLPREAREIIDTIQAAGGLAYVVGGAVRDMLMGKTPKDWDFATTLLPAALLALFPGATLVGGSMGTVRVPMGVGHCEITPCRIEGSYSDKRHPDEVRFVPDILADLARRDFTVNAMAWDGQMLLDPFGGQQDIEKRLLRCVGDAAQRFAEDPLRVLRLFRFAAALGFTVELATFTAAGDAMPLLDTLPAERVVVELRRILLSRGPQVLGPIIARGGLRRYGLNFAPSLAPLAEVPPLPLCRWWALMALCGADPGEMGAGLGFSRRFVERLAECTRLYRLGPAKDKLELKQKLSHAKLEYGPVVDTFAAVSPAFGAEPALFVQLSASGEPYKLADLCVDGEMLREEGIHGKQCGLVLNELLAAVIKNPALNKPAVLLGLARGLKQLL